MKAIVYENYGPPEVVQVRDLPKPVPRPGEVLIRIHATSVTVGDYRTRSLELPPGFGPMGRLMFGLFRPKQPVLGMELAGVIEAVGDGVTLFKTGDEVFGTAGFALGAHAEYRCLPQDAALALKPKNLGFLEAAALPFGGETALHFLRKANLQRGETILINGASGNVGTMMVQLARHFGAEVTGVCSAGNAELVRSVGADHIIDYAKTDFATTGQHYDVIADCVDNVPYARAKGALTANGRLVQVVSSLGELFMASFRGGKVIGGGFKETAEDMRILADLAANGHLKPVIDRTFPLDQAVEAHRYVDTGRKRGSVMLEVYQAT